MDLSFIDKLITFITLPFTSFLSIEILLIFIILYIFLVYNEKRRNKKVKMTLISLIIFFFSLLVFYFQEDIISVLSEIIKTFMRCFYFPNIVFYILTAIISLIILIYTNLKSNLIKLNKIITYTLTIIHLYLFTNFISLAMTNNISLIDTANIYQHDNMFVIVLFSQIIFILLIIYKVIYHFCYIRREKLKNTNQNDIMSRKWGNYEEKND